MLKNIKSFFIIKTLFSFIKDKIKLDLIKYNKEFQNKFLLDILYYRNFSGKYIIYVSNKIVEEYNSYNDELIFEGEYLNGKRNGRGKEYSKSILIFEGKYSNGKRHGHGKEYNNFGKLKFDGIFSFGKKWNGLEYDIQNDTVYKIENGRGFIKEYNSKGLLIFEGEYNNGEKNGNGKEYWNNGNIKFEGKYLNGKKWNGQGYDNQKDLIYNLKDGKGKIKIYDNNFLIFEGDYSNGEKNGKGKEYKNYEIIFEGEYLNGKKKRKRKRI